MKQKQSSIKKLNIFSMFNEGDFGFQTKERKKDSKVDPASIPSYADEDRTIIL